MIEMEGKEIMRLISSCIICTMFVLPAFAGHLPTVDVTSGAVSARAAFGEKVVAPAKKQVSKKVVARNASKKNDIAFGSDILIPNRPADNLWTSTDAPLRMPRADEFAVLRSEDTLPEENIDSSSSLDFQIARLNDLQRKANESVNVKPIDISSPIFAATEVAPKTIEDTKPVKVSRMVVPMSRDVVTRAVEKSASPKISAVRDDMANLNPSELRKAFRKTFLSENKHLSTYPIDNKFDVASDMSSSIEGFTAVRDLSEAGGIRPLEIKIKFRNADSALSRENYNLLSEYAGIVVNNPKRAIQVSIPQSVTTNSDSKKLAARRLAIIEQVLRDTGVSEQRIMPVLSSRDDDEGFLLRIISGDQYETLTKQQKNMFGDTVSKKTYKSMSW